MTHSFPTRRSSDLLSWGRHDYCQYAIRQWDIAPDGNQAYQYDFVWAELQAHARIDGTVFQNKNDLLRLQSVWFTAPQDTARSSFLSTIGRASCRARVCQYV